MSNSNDYRNDLYALDADIATNREPSYRLYDYDACGDDAYRAAVRRLWDLTETTGPQLIAGRLVDNTVDLLKAWSMIITVVSRPTPERVAKVKARWERLKPFRGRHHVPLAADKIAARKTI